MGNPNFQTGLFPHRVRPCAVMKSPSHSGRGSRSSVPHRTHHGQAGHPFNDLRPIVNGILWILHTGTHGVTSRNVTVPGRRSSGASTGGGRTALGAVSSPRCWTNWTTKGRSITTSGVSMAPSSGPARRRRGRKKTTALNTARTGSISAFQLDQQFGSFGFGSGLSHDFAPVHRLALAFGHACRTIR